MSKLHEKVAAILEAVAEDLDNNAYNPAEIVTKEAADDAQETASLAAAFAQATGEAPSDDELHDLKTNPAFRSTILKAAAHVTSHVDTLGGPAGRTVDPRPPLRGEAAIKQARDNFQETILALVNK